jgi:hypothetical protein
MKITITTPPLKVRRGDLKPGQIFSHGIPTYCHFMVVYGEPTINGHLPCVNLNDMAMSSTGPESLVDLIGEAKFTAE